MLRACWRKRRLLEVAGPRAQAVHGAVAAGRRGSSRVKKFVSDSSVVEAINRSRAAPTARVEI